MSGPFPKHEDEWRVWIPTGPALWVREPALTGLKQEWRGFTAMLRSRHQNPGHGRHPCSSPSPFPAPSAAAETCYCHVLGLPQTHVPDTPAPCRGHKQLHQHLHSEVPTMWGKGPAPGRHSGNQSRVAGASQRELWAERCPGRGTHVHTWGGVQGTGRWRPRQEDSDRQRQTSCASRWVG